MTWRNVIVMGALVVGLAGGWSARDLLAEAQAGRALAEAEAARQAAERRAIAIADDLSERAADLDAARVKLTERGRKHEAAINDGCRPGGGELQRLRDRWDQGSETGRRPAGPVRIAGSVFDGWPVGGGGGAHGG